MMTTTLFLLHSFFTVGNRSRMSSKRISLPANLDRLRQISSMLSDFRPGTPVR